MPTLSASDYTTYLKLQAAQQSYRDGAVPKKVQTTDQAAPNVSVINAYLKTSQAAYVVNAAGSSIAGLNYVQGVQPKKTNNPSALSTVGYAGTSGALGSSAVRRPGGLPANNTVSTYTRLPQNAGW